MGIFRLEIFAVKARRSKISTKQSHFPHINLSNGYKQEKELSKSYTSVAVELEEETAKEINLNEDKSFNEKKLPSKLCLKMRKPAFLTWILCICVFTYFSYEGFQEFLQNNPVSIITYRNISENEAMVALKICNNLALDPRKLQTFKNKHGPDSSGVPVYISHPLKNFYVSSSQKLEELKLDLGKFMIGCEIYPYQKSCFNLFKWHLETMGSCYEAILDLYSVGKLNPILIDLYFDLKLHDKENVLRSGVSISVSHADDYVSLLDGVFVGPRQQTSINVEIVHKTQKISIPKAKCVHRYGLENFKFTGKPFEANYHLESCTALCFAEKEYKNCNCTFYLGWNLTNTECLEKIEARKCLLKQNLDSTSTQKLFNRCNSKCQNQCNRKMVENEVKHISNIRLTNSTGNYAHLG